MFRGERWAELTARVGLVRAGLRRRRAFGRRLEMRRLEVRRPGPGGRGAERVARLTVRYRRNHRRPQVLGGALAVMVCVATGASFGPALIGANTVAVPHHRPVVIPDPTPAELPNVTAAAVAPAAPLPPAVTAPAPAPPAVSSAVLKSHEVFGFAPYWTLASASGFDLKDLTTVAYFGVDAAADGSLIQNDAGWNGYQSQALADLITRAHAAGDRVVLSAECFDQPSLDRLTHDAGAQATLADNLIRAIAAKSMDGLNVDFEGLGSADRAGMVQLISYLAGRVRAANPHWQLTVDTYAGSATDSNGFFDVRAMAQYVDAVFVMAYDMYQSGVASPNAPLSGPGANDEAAVSAYASEMPASKVILGIPFYGYTWQTSSNGPRAPVTSGPAPVSYAQVTSLPLPVYWDPQGQVPWTAFQDGQQQWHELYFDDPQSVALKAQVADYVHLLGVGIWALGMDGNNPAMMSALLGHSPVVKNYQSGPTTVSPSASSTTTSTSTTSTTAPKPKPTTTTTTTQPPPSPLLPSSTSTTTPSKQPSPTVTIPLLGGSRKSGL
ncbi:MAG TPA: glycoside hydrolase family 18 protein [Acidimicrobiales bacterium]|nr:glycoside hydrolase family 18 protein [Acidimicrobiales bacterium]